MLCVWVGSEGWLWYNIKCIFFQVFRRVRRQIIPPLTSSLDDVFTALKGYDFGSLECLDLLVNDQMNKIVLLGSAKGLKYLAAAEHILGDGTFKYCTRLFEQLYTFHAFGENGVYVPCAYFLLANKSQKTYTCMLYYLQEVMSRWGIPFVPINFHVDLEMAMIKSINTIYPHSNIRLCNFHLGQAWWRKIHSLGLGAIYNTASETGEWLKMFFGMSSLPHSEVGDFFTLMKSTHPGTPPSLPSLTT